MEFRRAFNEEPNEPIAEAYAKRGTDGKSGGEAAWAVRKTVQQR